MMMEMTEWLRSMIGLFFVVGIVEALLPPKNPAVKQILSLLILIGILTPFFHVDDIMFQEKYKLEISQNNIEEYEDTLSDQILKKARKEISSQIKQMYKDQTKQDLYSIEVKLELNKENQLTVLEVQLVIKEEIDSYNKDKIYRLLEERFGAKKVSFNKVN